MKTSVDVLREAKQLLLTEGWAQCDYVTFDHDGAIAGYCLLGAIAAVVERYDESSVCRAAERAEFALGHALNVAAGEPRKVTFKTIVSWNDEKGRELPEVIDLLDKTILKEAHDQHDAVEVFDSQERPLVGASA